VLLCFNAYFDIFWKMFSFSVRKCVISFRWMLQKFIHNMLTRILSIRALAAVVLSTQQSFCRTFFQHILTLNNWNTNRNSASQRKKYARSWSVRWSTVSAWPWPAPSTLWFATDIHSRKRSAWTRVSPATMSLWFLSKNFASSRLSRSTRCFRILCFS